MYNFIWNNGLRTYFFSAAGYFKFVTIILFTRLFKRFITYNETVR